MPTVNETRLTAYLAAEARVLAGGQSVKIATSNGERSITLADIKWLQGQINMLQRAVSAEQAAASGRSRFSRADFSDFNA